jgi:hypothetical protein
MTLKDLLEKYLNGQMTAIHLIRVLSGMFNPDHAINILALICQITRIEEGDLDKETFREIWLKPKKEDL